jgi:dihydrofolate reductase
MQVSLIAAMDRERLMGSASGRLPWRLPGDIAHFRAATAGKWLLLGRTTYEEMEGWFTDQTPLILTRKADYQPQRPFHRVFTGVRGALDFARASGVGEVVVVGGAAVFAATMEVATRLILTRIEHSYDVPGGLYFPDFETSGEWHRVYAEAWPADDENAVAMRLEYYERRRNRPASLDHEAGAR